MLYGHVHMYVHMYIANIIIIPALNFISCHAMAIDNNLVYIRGGTCSINVSTICLLLCSDALWRGVMPSCEKIANDLTHLILETNQAVIFGIASHFKFWSHHGYLVLDFSYAKFTVKLAIVVFCSIMDCMYKSFG